MSIPAAAWMGGSATPIGISPYHVDAVNQSGAVTMPLYATLQVAHARVNRHDQLVLVFHVVHSTPRLGRTWLGHARQVTWAGAGLGLQIPPGAVTSAQVRQVFNYACTVLVLSVTQAD
jgi:hypothetical protein